MIESFHTKKFASVTGVCGKPRIIDVKFYYKLLKLTKKNMKSETNAVPRVEDQRSILRIVSIFKLLWTKSVKKFLLIPSKQP